MITISATIRWNGTHLVCQYENGHRESMPWDFAIDASTDSHMIASQFGDAVSVDHDRDAVHVQYEMVAEEYEIGGVGVKMAAHQAARWNTGDTDERDLDSIEVSIPDRWEVLRDGNSGRLLEASRTITLREALDESRSPETAKMMADMPANRIG